MEKIINYELEEIKQAVEKEYRTDHLTLPVVPPFPDEEEVRWALLEREIVLNPNMDENTVVDKFGTTLKERREQLLYGKLPKNATKDAKDSKGKHTFETEIVDGIKTVVVVAPEVPEPKVVEPVVVVPPKDLTAEAIIKDFPVEVKETPKADVK